jgi:hypothetical protein
MSCAPGRMFRFERKRLSASYFVGDKPNERLRLPPERWQSLAYCSCLESSRPMRPGGSNPSRSARGQAARIVAGAPNGCSAGGMTIVPSSRWWFSVIAMIVRPTATAVPFSVCTWRGAWPSAGR